MYQKETLQMLSLIREATKLEILPRYQNVTPEIKKASYTDYVTEADRAASKYILDRIREEFPGSYSEEHKHNDRFDGHEFIWQIDPIDGTQEFCEEFADGFGTGAALLRRDNDGNYMPVANIIYLPIARKAWYYDGTNIHHEVDGVAQELPDISSNHLKGYVRKVLPSHPTPEIYENIAQALDVECSVISSGGAASSFVDILEGRINLHLFSMDLAKDWDLGMGYAILKARGAWIFDLSGHEFTNLNNPDDQGGEPYLRNGWIIGIGFTPEQIMPHISIDQLEKIA